MATLDSTVILGNRQKTVGDPNTQYESLRPIYVRNRAALSGQRYIKQIDRRPSYDNILIPFSPTMSQAQYDVYKAEAEWPSFSEQYARTLVGGLLRKPPQLTLPDGVPEEAMDWIMSDFSQENGSLISFLDGALWEELNTSRAFVCVNYPVTNPDEFTPEELQPYPVLLSGESIINYATSINPRSNKLEISRLIVRMFREVPSETNPYHPDYIDTTWVHELDDQGYYQIIIFEQSKEASAGTEVISGRIQQNYGAGSGGTNVAGGWTEVERETSILRNGERLDYIPIFPLNGSIEAQEPMLSNLINREIGLYNKISRRNHLLYGAAAYTPVIFGENLSDEQQDDIVAAGLGSWIFLGENDKVDIMSAPTDALQDLDRAIDSTVQDMARLGMRILAPETNSDQSGVALEIRNAAQTSQLATMNAKVSETVRSVIRLMVNWRYNTDFLDADFEFTLSDDFSPVPIGADWLRLVSEWYESGIISKSAFLNIAKGNDILPADYDDDEAMEEIEQDPNVVGMRERFAMVEQPMAQAAIDASNEDPSAPGEDG